MERANAACNYISQVAWDTQTFGQYKLQKLLYREAREKFKLTAQVAIHCIIKVVNAYKLDREVRRTFRDHGAITYDDRILRWRTEKSFVSIWTIHGRRDIPFVCGKRQWELLKTRQGESDLIYLNDQWYLLATCEVESPTPIDIEGVLGIDLGVTNIATDSDGEIHSGKAIKNVRHRHRRLRQKLQKKRTHGARRRLKKLSGKERRFARHVNHVLSKGIVVKAMRTKRAIALEDLTHIRTRTRARRPQRATLHSWAFAQLRGFFEYKAYLAGVPVHFVDPRNTSRTCPACGHCAKENRKTQALFLCTSCGFAGPADVIAAGNIAGRASVSRPYYSDTTSVVVPE